MWPMSNTTPPAAGNDRPDPTDRPADAPLNLDQDGGADWLRDAARRKRPDDTTSNRDARKGTDG